MTTGPDAPIDSNGADLLGRHAFVDEIVDLVINTPKEWTPRIGVYGSWGSGKTSVLNMIGEELHEYHVVVRFTPWGFCDADEMFDGLADAILCALQDRRNETKKAWQRLEKFGKGVEKRSKTIDRVVKSATDLHIPGAETVSALIGSAKAAGTALKRVFKKKKAAQLLDDLQRLVPETRCVALLDDLDRVDPSLLPQLLFALHEVLTEIPIVFVAALDPKIVGAALSVHHPGFGDGLAFLEKMIQFPRWLPDVNDDERRNLAMADIQRFLPEVDHDALRQEFDLLPRNPRELRALLRNLWGLRSQSSRYHPDEISWNLILRIAVLQHRHRQELRVLLEDESRLRALLGAQWFANRNDEDQEAKTRAKVDRVAQELQIDPNSMSEIIDLLQMRELRWSSETIIQHANLTERPAALTRRELEEALRVPQDGALPKTTDDELRNVLLHQAESVRRTVDEIADDALSHFLAMHDEWMSHSADGAFEQITLDRIEATEWTVAMVGALVRLASTTPSAEQFSRILSTYARWAHFSSIPYRSLHARERELLVRLCHETRDPGGYLEVVAPWRHDRQPEKQTTKLWRELALVLEAAVEPTLDRILERSDGVSSMFGEKRSAERWCLLRRSAWTSGRLSRFSTLRTVAASDNALDLLRIIANVGGDARPARFGFVPTELDAMAQDRAITDVLWSVFIHHPINVRFFTSVVAVRAELEQRRGVPLPDPSWWERVRAIRQEITKNEDDVDDDYEPAIRPPSG